MTKVNKNTETTIQATAKSNILQADPILLSVIANLSECRASIEGYYETYKDSDLDFIKEKASDLDDDIFSCISTIGDMIGYQIANNALNICSHE